MNPIDPIFEWVCSASLRATVLAAGILAIRFALRGRLPAGWRHALWLPMVLVLVVPQLPGPTLRILPARAAATTAPALDPGTLVATPAERAPSDASVSTVAFPLPGRLASVWLAGAALLLSAGLVGHGRHLRRIRHGARSPQESLARLLEGTTREAGLRRTPEVLVSPAVEGPAVTGLFRPRLLLPAMFPEGFRVAEARLILLHEFTHLKRLDLPLNTLLHVLQCLHWFNPVLWLAFARMRADRESACDARVLSLVDGDARADYGNALIKLQMARSEDWPVLGFVGLIGTRAGLRSRILEISRHRSPRAGWRITGGVLVGAVALAGAADLEERARVRSEGGPAAKEAAEPDPRQVAIEKKLDAIVLPSVEIKDRPIEEAIDFLRISSVELDRAGLAAPAKGVNFVIRRPRKDPPEPSPRVTLDLKKVTLRQALDQVGRQTAMRYTVDAFAVTLVPADEPEVAGPAAKEAPRAAGRAMADASRIVIPVVDLIDVRLSDAIEFLNKQAAKQVPQGKAPAIRLGARTNPDVVIRELRLRNVPLSEAAKYVARAARQPLAEDGDAIRIGF